MVKKNISLLIMMVILIIIVKCQKNEIEKEVLIDNANLLNAKEKKILEKEILNYEKESLNEIVILTIKSLDGEDIDKYSVKMHNRLGVGKLQYLNGILIVVSKLDRKIRINVAEGLVSSLTEERCKYIINNSIVPNFKKQKYLEGLLETISQVKKYAKNDWK